MRQLFPTCGGFLPLLLIALACAESTDEEAVTEFDYATETGALEATFAGVAADAATFVAIVRSGTAFMVYACDNEHGNWFRATALSTPMLLQNEDGDQIGIALDGDHARGALLRAGEAAPIEFDITQTDQEVLFRAEAALGGADFIGGWIVLPDGQQRGKATNLSTGAKLAVVLDNGKPKLDGAEVPKLGASLAAFVPAALQKAKPFAKRDFHMFTLGDSYASGEGAPEQIGSSSR